MGSGLWTVVSEEVAGFSNSCFLLIIEGGAGRRESWRTGVFSWAAPPRLPEAGIHPSFVRRGVAC